MNAIDELVFYIGCVGILERRVEREPTGVVSHSCYIDTALLEDGIVVCDYLANAYCGVKFYFALVVWMHGVPLPWSEDSP